MSAVSVSAGRAPRVEKQLLQYARELRRQESATAARNNAIIITFAMKQKIQTMDSLPLSLNLRICVFFLPCTLSNEFHLMQWQLIKQLIKIKLILIMKAIDGVILISSTSTVKYVCRSLDTV